MKFRSYCEHCRAMTDHVEEYDLVNPHIVKGTLESKSFTVETARSVKAKCAMCANNKNVVRSNA